MVAVSLPAMTGYIELVAGHLFIALSFELSSNGCAPALERAQTHLRGEIAVFCGDCTRARLSADGELFTCLFASRGVALRPLLADEAALSARIASLWQARGDRYSELRAERERAAATRVEMFRMGG